MIRLRAAGLGLAALLLTACGAVVDPLAPASSSSSGSASAGSVVVGSGPSTESKVLAELYAQALTARGLPASTRTDIGPREAYLRALGDGSVSLVPEYAGQLLLSYDENATATTAAEVDQALPEALPSDLTLGTPARAVDQDTYVVTRQFSQRHRVTSLADLARLPNGLVLGGPPGLASQGYGPVGLDKIYGAKLEQVKTYESSAVRARDLRSGRIQLGEFRSTEPVISDRGFVALADPQAMILPQHVVPLMRSALAESSTATAALDAVQAALTTEQLAALGTRVDEDQVAPQQAAAEWLVSQGIS